MYTILVVDDEKDIVSALFMKVEWKPIHHSVNLTSLPSPAVKN